MNKYWAQGFEKRCQERGVDPNALIKWASTKDERAERDSKDPSGMRPVLRGTGRGAVTGMGVGAGIGALAGGIQGLAGGAMVSHMRDLTKNPKLSSGGILGIGLAGLLRGAVRGGYRGAGIGGVIGGVNTARKL